MSGDLSITRRKLEPEYLDRLNLEQTTDIALVPLSDGKICSQIPQFKTFFLEFINNSSKFMTIENLEINGCSKELEKNIGVFKNEIISITMEPANTQKKGGNVFKLKIKHNENSINRVDYSDRVDYSELELRVTII